MYFISCNISITGTYPVLQQTHSCKPPTTTPNDLYCDITSGNLYKELTNTIKPLVAECNFVTLSLNTDGIPVFRSSGQSFWPIYLSINELPYKLRYAS